MKLLSNERACATSLLCLWLCASACSPPSGNENARVGTSTSAIVYGAPSTEEEDYVVDLYVSGLGVCTGTLVAPTVIVTALHCVSVFNRNLPFTCNTKGELSPQAAGAGEFGETIAPERIEVRVGPDPAKNEPDARGARIFGSGSDNICANDIAVFVTDTPLDPEPRRVRLGKPTPRGEHVTVVGYGEDEHRTVRIRNRRSGVRVVGVGEFDPYEADGSAAPRTLMLGEGPCFGDSGGPAFSEESGALTGVFSLGASSGCEGAAIRNTFTQVAPFEDLLREAAEFAGAELLPEFDEPVGGSTGDAGAGGTRETGGSASGGDATAGGATSGSGVGGSGASSGGSLGESGATSGSGVGGSAATSSGGSGNESSATGGTRTGEGSGSREDPSCTCRLENAATNSSSAWVGFVSVLAAMLVRRRRR
jgi:hypothetical protein